MVVQSSELADANHVKEILESVTGDKYVVKSKVGLVSPEKMSWFVHIPLGTPSYIGDAFEAEGKIVFESPTLFEVYQDMEYRFSESKYVRLREKLGDDVDGLLDRKIRGNYRELLPQVVRFLDEAETIVLKVNKECLTDLSLANYRGSITLVGSVKVTRLDAHNPTIRRTAAAMKEAVIRIGKWQDAQREKSGHMGQIRKTHRELLGTERQ